MKTMKHPIAWCGMLEANETGQETLYFFTFFKRKKMLYPELTHSKNLQNNCDPSNTVSCWTVQTEGK